MANILDFGGVRVLTSNAQPGAGYVARFYVSGTTSPVTVYTDATLATAHGTSVTADAAGRFPAVWSSGGAIKCVIEDALGAVVQTIDPVLSVSGAGSAADDITFTPTVDLPFTNVQDAIEGAAASAASGFAPFGLGITGNAALLANIDATNIGAGVYRFDGTTTGTYPSGVSAATTGIVTLDRQTASEAVMTLRAAGASRVFIRLLSTTWGTWREVATLPPVFGTAGQVARVNAGATALEYTAGINRQTAIATSGQTSIDFTGIPAWINRITVMGIAIGTNGTAFPIIRVGDGAVVTTGYTGAAANLSGAPSGLDFSSGCGLTATWTAASVLRFTCFITRIDGNTWMFSGTGSFTGSATATAFSSQIALSGALDRVRLTTSGGTDTFDAGGTVNVAWE